jgi:hypothetical protein
MCANVAGGKVISPKQGMGTMAAVYIQDGGVMSSYSYSYSSGLDSPSTDNLFSNYIPLLLYKANKGNNSFPNPFPRLI